MNGRQEFVVVWDSRADPNVNERNVFGQRYDSLGGRVGDEFRIGTYVAGDQRYPAVAMGEDGGFVAVWQSYGQDGSGYGVFGCRGPKVGSADLTGDEFVDFGDYCVLAEDWLRRQEPLKADLIDDNRIDAQDLGAFCARWLTPCYECSEVDISGDGRIDFKDYCLLAKNWLHQGPLKGDITGEGAVDMGDLQALILQWSRACE